MAGPLLEIWVHRLREKPLACGMSLEEKKMLFCARFPASLEGVCSLEMLGFLSARLTVPPGMAWDGDVAPAEGQKAAKGKRKPAEI